MEWPIRMLKNQCSVNLLENFFIISAPVLTVICQSLSFTLSLSLTSFSYCLSFSVYSLASSCPRLHLWQSAFVHYYSISFSFWCFPTPLQCELSSLSISVTRFGKVSPLWQKINVFGKIWKVYFVHWQKCWAYLWHYWAKFPCCKWANIEN